MKSLRTDAALGVSDDLRTLGVDRDEIYAITNSTGDCSTSRVAVGWVFAGVCGALLNHYLPSGGGTTSKCSERDERFAEHVSYGL